MVCLYFSHAAQLYVYFFHVAALCLLLACCSTVFFFHAAQLCLLRRRRSAMSTLDLLLHFDYYFHAAGLCLLPPTSSVLPQYVDISHASVLSTFATLLRYRCLINQYIFHILAKFHICKRMSFPDWLNVR